MPQTMQVAGFDVQAARQAGYTEDEILEHLTTSRKFDVQGAVKSGYTKDELINYLSGSVPVVDKPGPSSADLNSEQRRLSESQSNFKGLQAGISEAGTQIGNQLEGAKNLFSHPYDTIIKPGIQAGAGIVKDITLGQGSSIPERLVNSPTVRNTVQSTLAPVTTSLRGAGAIVAPNSITAPTDEQFADASKFAGANAAGLIAGEIAGRSVPAIKGVIDQSNLKAADAATLKAANPAAYTQSHELMAEALGAKSSESRYMDLADTTNVAMDEIQKSAKDALRGPITSNREQILAGKHAMDRIYNTEIGPKVALVEQLDLRPLAEKLKSEIPNTFSERERAAISKNIDDQLNKTVSGPEAERLRQKFSAAGRVNLALNGYEKSAVEKLPTGYRLKVMNDGLRDYLANAVDHVQPGTDIRPALQRYGAVTDLVQQSGGIPVDKSLIEIVTGKSYITGTTPNITGRAVDALTKKWYANDNLIRRAYAKYTGPIAKPAVAATGVKTLTGQQPDLIPNDQGMFNTGIPPSTGDTQGNLFGQPMVKGPTISQDLTNGTQPVKVMESLVKPGRVGTSVARIPTEHISVSGELMTADEYANRFNSKPMPQTVPINRQALYGAPAPKSLTAAPFEFKIHGQPVTRIPHGSMASTPDIIASTTDTHGAMANRYPPNWQLDSTVKGTPPGETHTGPGTYTTTNPKLVETEIAQLDKLIKSTKVKTRLDQLTTQRDNLVRQMIQYRKQRGVQ